MPDNEHKSFIETSLENIRKAHNENYLSIFAGAGISAGSGLPSWDKLMETLREKLYGKIERNEGYHVRAEKFLEQHGIPSQKELADFIKEIEKKLKKELCDEIKRGGDYLILAEKFFNQFGHNIYYQTLREVLKTPEGNNAEPNILHFEIVKLNLKNLITTNWDNLFELASYKVKKPFDIVEMDANIGNSTGLPKLLKIHGGLNRGNVVFREKDYLEYSQNFPLIENYVKGVFATDVVVLVGYSLGDPNVKQIISWVNSCSDNVKPIYFIKTNNPFERIEFEFYKNKNIHVLYLRELFDDKNDKGKLRHEKELRYFFEKIKEKYDEVPVLSNKDVEEIRQILISFNFKVLKKKTRTLVKSKEIPLKDKLLRHFLLFENFNYMNTNRKDILKMYRQCRGISEESFRNGEFKIWFSSELNRFWGFHPNECDEPSYDEWEQFLLDLPSNERNRLKHIFGLEKYFEWQVMRSLSYWRNRKFSHHRKNINSEQVLAKFQEFDRIRIGNCLIIPRLERYRMAYVGALECYWRALSAEALGEKAGVPSSLLVNQEVFSHSIRYFKTRELGSVFRECFSDMTLRFEIKTIKSNESRFLEEIFTNICLRFKEARVLKVEGKKLFNNFILLASYCSLKQSTFDKILKEFNDNMEERVINLNNGYDQLEELIIRQSKYHRNGTLSFEKCQDLVLTFLRLFIKGKADNNERVAQSVFLTIVEKIQEINGQWIDMTHENLIIKFLKIIHEKPPEYTRVIDDNKSFSVRLIELPYKIYSDKEQIKTLSSDELEHFATFLPFIKALYQSSDEDVKKAIKDKLRYILDHKEDYAQTKASEKYCEWLKELIENLDSSS
ncbi:SIR2 family protein [Helicobacter bizzozeronii]|uniref:SIR2 family protein n=1 Tax=Helicobacter bizzozeronii TaxID=56877 RepID=UPI001F3E2B79|nr:SIR2 family protein [Helicobacter bizzozeronii]